MSIKHASSSRNLLNLHCPQTAGSNYTSEIREIRPTLIACSIIRATILLLITSLWLQSAQASDPMDVDILRSTGSCPGCDLSGAMLDAVDAEGGEIWNANLRGARLYRAQLNNADLRGADLTGANLTRASLEGADLSGAIFAMAITSGVLTDASTVCPDGTPGPCILLESNR